MLYRAVAVVAHHYSLLTTYYSLLTPLCSLLTTHYSLPTTYYWLLSAYYLLLTTYYLLLTTYYLLQVRVASDAATQEAIWAALQLVGGVDSAVLRSLTGGAGSAADGYMKNRQADGYIEDWHADRHADRLLQDRFGPFSSPAGGMPAHRQAGAELARPSFQSSMWGMNECRGEAATFLPDSFVRQSRAELRGLEVREEARAVEVREAKVKGEVRAVEVREVEVKGEVRAVEVRGVEVRRDEVREDEVRGELRKVEGEPGAGRG